MQEIYGTAAIDTKKLFQRDILEIATRSACPASYRCRLDRHGEFIEDLEGEWYFWQDITLPFTGQYYIGVDPAIGVADSALAGVAVVDVRTGITVATAALRECNAVELARAIEALSKKLCGPRASSNAIVVYESQGIGVSFLTELRRLRYGAIWKGENKKYGVANKDKGELVLTELGRAIGDGEILISDHRIVDDLEHFEYNSKVDLVFTGAIGHGDLGQAVALAWWAGRHRRRAIMEAESPKIDLTREPIEREPGYQCSNGKRKAWSNRFQLTRY